MLRTVLKQSRSDGSFVSVEAPSFDPELFDWVFWENLLLQEFLGDAIGFYFLKNHENKFGFFVEANIVIANYGFRSHK